MYDAIVIGARCAGASTAMLLARRARPSYWWTGPPSRARSRTGTSSTSTALARLGRWGLLEPLLDTNCPPVTSMTMDYGDFPLTGHDLEVDGIPLGLGPRRAQLDQVLVDAAVDAGVELRDGFAVQDLLTGERRTWSGVRGRDARTGATPASTPAS